MLRPLPGGPKECICPMCGERVLEARGIPCRSKKCPKCGSYLIKSPLKRF